MIYESVDLKENSFSLQPIATRTGFANAGPVFYKVHSVSFEQVSPHVKMPVL